MKMEYISSISTLITFYVVLQLFSVILAVDSARESDKINGTSSLNHTIDVYDGVEHDPDENIQTVYWNHTVRVLGNCTTPSNFLLPWQPTNLKVCTEKSEIDEEGNHLSRITLYGKINEADAPCNWFICARENQFVQVTLEFSSRLVDDERKLASYITMCGGYAILANGTLQCRKMEVVKQRRIQTFIVTGSVAVLSLSSIPHYAYAWVQILNYDPTCGSIYIREANGTIESPGHPNHSFPKFFYCRYKFVAAPDERINFTVEHFTIPSEYNKPCQYAKMIIRDGLDLMFPHVNTYCDDNPPPHSFLSLSNSVEISFHVTSNFWRQTGSYKISWFAEPVQLLSTWNTSNPKASNFSEEDTEYGITDPESIPSKDYESRQSCGGLLVDGDGYIKPDFPYDYQDNVTCTWLLADDFKNANGKTRYARLTLFRMKVVGKENCSNQFLEIVEECTVHDLKTGCFGGRITKYCSDIDLDRSSFTTSFSGKYVKIRFFKMGELIWNTFSAYFQYLDFNPEMPCPMSYHLTGGSLMTPGYPSSFPNYFECVWEIIVPFGLRLNFTFVYFQNEDEYVNDESAYRHFSFRDGLDSTLPAYKNLLIRNESSSFSSSSNHVGFRLKTGYTSPSKRKTLKIAWKTQEVGCNESINSQSGIMASPGYPHRIKTEMVCTWNITVSKGHSIKITFAEVDFNNFNDFSCKHNYIKVTDGSTEDDMKFDIICNTLDVRTLTTKTNFVQILLKITDVHMNYKGIKFRYEAVCSMENERFNGVIESINYPEGYPYSISCLWEFRGTLGNSIVLRFVEFLDIQMNVFNADTDFFLKNSLKIYECDLKCTFLNETVAKDSILRIDDKSVKVEFNTITDIKNAVFHLQWSIEGCVYTVEAFEGNIQSPNYPKTYKSNLHCMWKIITDSGTSVQLTIHNWKLEQSQNCQFDSLKVYGGSNENSQQLILLCGGKGKLQFSNRITSKYNTMFITLTTDDSRADSGFNATFRQIDKSDNNLCHVEVDSTYGYIYSPGYPNFYKNLQNCTTTVRVHSNFRSAIIFVHFHVENRCFDVVRLYRRDIALIKELCAEHGKFPNDGVFVSVDNTIIVNFQSDNFVVARGFKAIYYQVQTCDATLRSEFGAIATPDYMTVMMMHPKFVCNWTIQAPSSDHRVALIFFELTWNTTDASCSEHLIQVFDDGYAKPIGRGITGILNSKMYYSGCCGPPPTPIISTGNTLILEMLGIGNIGFSALYLALTPECLQQLGGKWCDLGGNGTHDACTKHVTMDVDNGFSFHLTFRNFSSVNNNNTNDTGHCTANFLKIYEDGFDGVYLTTICRRNIPTGIFQTSGGKYVVVYLVDEPEEKVIESNSTLPWVLNGKRNDCKDEHCQQTFNVRIISAAILIFAIVVAAGVLRMCLQIRRQRREADDVGTQIQGEQRVSTSMSNLSK